MRWSAAGAVFSAWLVGSLWVAALWPRGSLVRRDLALVLPLGLGFGLGATSAFFFVASLASSQPLAMTLTLELLAAAAGATALWLRRRDAGPASATTAPVDNRWLVALLGSVFAQAALLAAVATIRAYHLEPYSNSDGWVIWNMHARLLFRGGEAWPELLRAPQILWTHPDYPLLVPASVARAWAYVGSDAPGVAGLISTLFGASALALLVGAVARLRHVTTALVGGLVLLGTPFFVTFSSNQHADIPLAFFILAAGVLIALRGEKTPDAGLSALLGGAAGLAAWTKNEGVLFALIVALVWLGSEIRRRPGRNAGAFLAGLAVALLPVLHFKFNLAPANDLVSSNPLGRLGHLLDWSRHRLILSSLWRDVGRFGEWRVAPFVAMALPLLGGGWKRIRPREWLVAALLVLTLAGYYGVYLLTHWELAAHLDSSLVRLLMQLWPAAVFCWCLAATGEPELVSKPALPAPWTPRRIALFGLANIAVAAGVVALLERQLAANELAAGTVGGARVRVLLGDGWHGRETLREERWAWSKGDSTLRIRVEAAEPRTIKLRFDLRSLGSRSVSARIDHRVIWRAALRDGVESVAIAGLLLPPGTTDIVFQTDAAGVPESSAPGARALTYAIYNPEVNE